MRYEPKKITRESIPAALDKAERYRLLNQPDQAESIARDILAVDPHHRAALRELGLSLTDQLARRPERFAEAEQLFRHIADPYETPYLLGLLHERQCRAQLETGAAPETLGGLIEEAMRCYSEAERRRPQGNDDAILRWNSIVRLLEQHPHLHPDAGAEAEDMYDGPPM
jgi:tetratricopeptide (TPR) repeat protein